MTAPSDNSLHADATTIWQAAVAAVDSARLVRENVQVDSAGGRSLLHIAGEAIPLDDVGRIVVVGAGKAGAGMAAGFEAALGPNVMQAKQLAGWLNVPADCVRTLSHIHLHAARPAGVNEPTAEGAAGAEEILRLVGELGPRDLCIALISGGGSALLPLPIEGITLADKLAVTRLLSGAGAPIDELNTVRKQLSRIKGGGLARACGAGWLVTLVISDVLGDPLDLIASGPTVDDPSTPDEAIEILNRYGAAQAGIDRRVFDALEARRGTVRPPFKTRVVNRVIGNNAVAVEAAAEAARRLGYAVQSESAGSSEGPAEEIGRKLARRALEMRSRGDRACFISGGEPTVTLVEAERRGRGGRNQQLVLAAVEQLVEQLQNEDPQGILILSGGTDGEDGPTDAAGAWADAEIIAAAKKNGLNPADHLARNNAYPWFEATGGLIKTGPTHTNVCDVRVVLAASEQRGVGG